MDIVQEAFANLFPAREWNYNSHIKYSGQFKGYNANVFLKNKFLQFKLSKNWRGVDRDIKIGLIQELLVKIFKEKKQKTLNQDLYNIFLKEIHIAVPKTKFDPLLEQSFSKINQTYFESLIQQPNLVWINSINKLGSYEYGTDTLSISRILEPHSHLLDYVMHHELLHKKHKFKKSKSGNSHMHHTREFKRDEQNYPNHQVLELELSKLVTKHKIKNRFFPRQGQLKSRTKTKKSKDPNKKLKPKNFFLEMFGF